MYMNHKNFFKYEMNLKIWTMRIKVMYSKSLLVNIGCNIIEWKYLPTVKSVLSNHSKRRPKLVFKTNYHLMQVKSIAECSKTALITYDLVLFKFYIQT